MFCQECGAKNAEGSIFCEKCGTRLEIPVITRTPEIQKTQQQYAGPISQPISQPVSQSVSKPMSKKSKILLACIAVICIAVAVLYNVAKQQCSPEKYAEKYFLNVMNGEWGKAYNCLDITETQFINKDNFISSQENQEKIKVNTYKVNDVKNYKESLGTVVDITYRLKGDTENSAFSVSLNKQSGKRFFLFDTWKVSPTDYLSEDFSIHVPSGTVVNFDGVELDSSYINQDDTTYTNYIIPELFQGNYDLLLTHENMEDVNATISTYDASYYLDQMTLKEEATTAIVTAASEALQSFYSVGLSNADFSEVADYFSEDQTIRDEAKNGFEYFADNLNSDDGLGLYQIGLHDFTGNTSYEFIDGVLNVYIELTYNYDASYNYSDWWSGDTLSNTNSDVGYDNFTYIYENGKWVIKSADYDVVSY